MVNMNITAQVNEGGNLVLLADEATRQVLKLDRAKHLDFESDDYMIDLLEGLTCNSDYDWIRAEEIGALTDAPILGIRGKERKATERDNTDYMQVAGQWGGAVWVEDAEKAWGFMSYQVRSVQDDLADYGRAIFQNATE